MTRCCSVVGLPSSFICMNTLSSSVLRRLHPLSSFHTWHRSLYIFRFLLFCSFPLPWTLIKLEESHPHWIVRYSVSRFSLQAPVANFKNESSENTGIILVCLFMIKCKNITKNRSLVCIMDKFSELTEMLQHQLVSVWLLGKKRKSSSQFDLKNLKLRIFFLLFLVSWALNSDGDTIAGLKYMGETEVK